MAETVKPSIRTELKLCLGLLTRLPVRVDQSVSPAVMARSSRWFPAVGALVGGMASGALWLCLWIGLPDLAAVLVAIGFSILITGALHEDGLADVADGFGGGATRDAKLDIMRDSRAGTYGILALILAVGLKSTLLVDLVNNGPWAATIAMIIAATVSRLAPVVLMNRLSTARNDGMAADAGRPDMTSVRIACALALASLLLLTEWPAMLAAIVATLSACAAIGALASRQIGGQTGDVLGASQQVTEICVLAGLVAVGP